MSESPKRTRIEIQPAALSSLLAGESHVKVVHGVQGPFCYADVYEFDGNAPPVTLYVVDEKTFWEAERDALMLYARADRLGPVAHVEGMPKPIFRTALGLVSGRPSDGAYQDALDEAQRESATRG